MTIARLPGITRIDKSARASTIATFYKHRDPDGQPTYTRANPDGIEDPYDRFAYKACPIGYALSIDADNPLLKRIWQKQYLFTHDPMLTPGKYDACKELGVSASRRNGRAFSDFMSGIDSKWLRLKDALIAFGLAPEDLPPLDP